MFMSTILALNWSLLTAVWTFGNSIRCISYGKWEPIFFGPVHSLPLCHGGHFIHVSIVLPTKAASVFLPVEMSKNAISSLSFTSWKNYGMGRIMFIQVHLGIDYDTQCNLHLPKPIPNGSDPCALGLNFYKSVQISLWEEVQLLLLLLLFQKLKAPEVCFKGNFYRYFPRNWK